MKQSARVSLACLVRLARLASMVAVTVAVVLLAGCGGGASDIPRSLIELERMAYVPAGIGSLKSKGFGGTETEYGVARALLVDRFEFTRGDWAVWGPEPGPWERLEREPWGPGEEALPAYMTYTEAAVVAARRGMRLLTASEWLFVSIGSFGLRYPWGGGRGAAPQAWANTLDLGLARPLSVGTFENGRSSRGCYDLLGNVWEWVADAAPGEFERPGEPESVRAFGGSYLTHERPIFAADPTQVSTRPVFFAIELAPGDLAEDVGARFCQEARSYLEAHAPEWRDPQLASRLQAIGRRWGPGALPLLQDWVEQGGAPEAVRQLLEGVRRGLE